MTINGINYSSIGGLNIKGQSSVKGSALRFARTSSTNPFDSTSNGLYVNTSNELVFANQGSSTTLGSAGGAVSLDTAYGQGAAITMDNGALTLNDSTAGAANTLTIAKSGAGSGDVFEITMSAAHTGRAINLDMNAAVAAVALRIDGSAEARTGADIQVVDDSTGTHNVIEINHSGSGAGTGFAWTDSYNTNSLAFAIKLTFDANDGLDSTGIQIVRNAGVRTTPAIDINEASTGSANVIDIDVSGVYTGDVLSVVTSAAATGNILYIDLDDALAATAIHIEGSGTRTQPFFELTSDSIGSAQYFDLDIAGAGSGNFIDVLVGAVTYTGNVLDIDLGATATGGQAFVVNSGIMTRTVDLLQVADTGTPSGDVMGVQISGAATGEVFDIDISGIMTGDVLDIVYSAAATGDAVSIVMADNLEGGALVITGAGARTDSIIDVTSSETGSMDGMVLINTSGVFTGHMLTVRSSGAATTGGLIHLNLDAGVAYKAITIDHAGARTAASVLVTFDGTVGAAAGGTFLDGNITMTGASANPWIDIDVTAAYVGNIFDVLLGADADISGDILSLNLGATATTAQAMVVASGAMNRSTALIAVSDAGTSSGATFDINHTGITTGIWFDLDATAATTGNVFDFATNSASTGTIFEINLTNAVAARAAVFTLAGTRTVNAVTFTDSMAGAVDIFEINDSGTKSGHVFDINVSGNTTGNTLDIVYSSSAVAGHAIHVDMGTDLAGNALLIDAANIRTAPLIYIANTATDGGTDDHVLFINQTGLLDSNLIQLTYATDASTGEAISIAMATNVAGRAIYVSSAGTGVTGEGNVLDVAHTGALVAGADAVAIRCTGSISSTSNVLSVEQTTGAGTEGAYALYVNATGANVEGLKVDAGAVVFDETLLVTGIATFTAKPVLPILTELNTTIDTHSTSAAINATATATAAEVATGYITSTSAAATTITLPTGTLLGGELAASAGDVFDLVIDNTAGANTVTIAAAVNGVLSTAGVDTAGSFGDLTVASGATGLAVYRIMFSSATAYAFTRVA